MAIPSTAEAESSRSASLMGLPSMPKLSVITSFFSSSSTSPTPADEDVTTSDSAATATTSSLPVMPSPTDSADPRAIFRAASRQDSFATGTESVTSRNKKQQPARPKVSFSICHPPPKAASKRQLRVRAKPLLQLHRIESNSRPKPAYQVLPSSIFSPRLSKAVGRIYGPRHGLCPTDLAVVKADEYNAAHTDLPAADDDHALEVIAIICGGGRKDSASPAAAVKMIFPDGSEWDGNRLSNGGYECSTTDEHGLTRTARWVQKKASAKPGDSGNQLEQAISSSAPKKFKFSTISPTSRRHPIIASLSSTSFDIFDSYIHPSAVSTPTTDAASSVQEQTPESVTTSQELRDLITASAVWVALCEHRSTSSFKDTLDTRSPSFKSISTSRSITVPSPPPSPTKRIAGSEDGHASNAPSTRGISLMQTFQRAPSLLRRQIIGGRAASSSLSSASLASDELTSKPQVDSSTSTSVPLRTRPRADTTSTVLINENAAQWQPDFNNEMHEADCEDDGEADGQDPEAACTYLDASADHSTISATKRKKAADTQVVGDKGDVSRSTSEGTVEREKGGAMLVAGPTRKRGGFLRKVLCGMI